MKEVFVFLANGFEEIEAISIIDILRRGEIKTTTVSITGDNKVVGAHEIPVFADKLFDEVNFTQGEMLILPGGMPGASNLNAHEKLKSLIMQYNSENKKIAAICAAPIVLGGLGLLEGKRATSYPGFESQLTGAQFEKTGIVKDGNIITGRGPGYATAFALYLLEELKDKNASHQVATGLLINE